MTLSGKRILLVIGGGIAAYKVLDLIRRLRERGAAVTPVMTKAAAEFVTPLAVGALSAARVHGDLFDREAETDVGHIRLAREADAVLVAPATADRMARTAAGFGDDLAGAILLATRAPVLFAPAMNPAMWDHPATRRAHAQLLEDGIAFVGPNRGEMAEAGEAGTGRMAEPLEIVAALEDVLVPPGLAAGRPLAGRRLLVTSGPTHEPIDPVRYIANRSSGRQGHAIAASLARLGADVTLVSGPVVIPDPRGVRVVKVETAREMMAAVEGLLPIDGAVFVAAVADWRTEDEALIKLKKGAEAPAPLTLTENPDILATVGHHRERPRVVVGFAAETNDLLANAISKLDRKGADLIVANDVSADAAAGRASVMGGVTNTVHLVARGGIETWPEMTKEAVAEKLAQRIAELLAAEASPSAEPGETR
ncbi:MULTISPECIES: bifunctional phosphopantothenoylcysteine decarboxylase/phosphopantothenate--cysteine ligase CoaBC [unclassified Aureimonas]|uniref:bifunctional phosphopantothenoylcysteine decarboxylase/phosphopantothenate--cysteine ligase CoaBC n=1 Tax=unclassified Aureimonas TaxID=2615206 RepID=UPI0007020D79|nr:MULTISPECIES: bifunctional phosphopantothenoylcysteine decarboxylase/phosphopantothenate--cysteine ligase CoaBC [unclassified Aureimonas]KQT64277.1 bifunctional phosphopantothenoylcysteine decarboxylase/phosphopantothenate synthase [Aureimonas sp. Leaf427]KQT81466.1 bifunctional phosphopantothenoylcysteine decarboxylase/phosphopantothenate synthase [Aureimonas sp. Leaf460]